MSGGPFDQLTRESHLGPFNSLGERLRAEANEITLPKPAAVRHSISDETRRTCLFVMYLRREEIRKCIKEDTEGRAYWQAELAEVEAALAEIRGV